MKKNKIIEFLKKHYRVLVIILFVISSLIIGLKHEPWLDEAQSWLIARDTSLYTLFFKYLHAEGHPALWYLILKFIQFLGVPYKYLFIVPIIFSTIGIIVLLYKSNFPWYIKCLLPFVFFIFYQYTIIARSYCLILPILALLASIWKERYEKIELFTLLLILLVSLELHTYLLAGSIYFYCLLETFIEWKKNKIKKDNKVYICFGILFLSFLITLLYVFPIGTTYVPFQVSEYFISDSFFTIYDMNNIIKVIVSILIVGYFLLVIYRDNTKAFYRLMLFLLPVIIFMNLIYVQPWHYGIITIMVIFIFWIDGLENKKSVKIFLLLFCIIQVPLNFLSCRDEYYGVYSPSESVSNFLKEYDYDNLNIISNNFHTGAINAYFDHNIFDNWQDDIGFLYLNITNKFMVSDYNADYVLDNDVDIYIACVGFKEIDYDKLTNYNLYKFKGESFFQGSVYEDQSYWVYVRKDIDENKTKES